MTTIHGLPKRLALGTVAAALVMIPVLPMPFAGLNGAALAEEDGGGKGGGGKGDGEDEGGGEDEGEEGGGKGKGKGGKPKPPPVPAPVVAGSDTQSAAMVRPVAPGLYMRAELGTGRSSASNASWLPPGYPGDPQVFFDLSSDSLPFGALALGYDWQNGWRGELAVNIFGASDFDGPWSYTVPETAGPHADVLGSMHSKAVLLNAYRDFAAGNGWTPFVTAGIGMSRNTMGEWTRINPDSDRTERTFEGGLSTGLAWSVGAGVAVDIGRIGGSAPAKLEIAYRYFDLGSVEGGVDAVPGSGEGGNATRALNFDVSDQVLSVGLRIPF